MEKNFSSYLESPYGYLAIRSSEKGITRIEIIEHPQNDNESHHTFLGRQELLDYFDGRLKAFTVNLDLQKHSGFHQSVWAELVEIPYGTTCSYMDIAKKMDNEKAIRAVGRANGLNPIPFIIPCHRVIGSNGSLTGYALGLEVKRKLLALENPIAYPLQQSLF